jgi:type I restriction enzyme R subunit
VDAVGVCEDEKQVTRPLDRKPYVALDKVLDAVKTGVADCFVFSCFLVRCKRERGLTKGACRTVL